MIKFLNLENFRSRVIFRYRDITTKVSIETLPDVWGYGVMTMNKSNLEIKY